MGWQYIVPKETGDEAAIQQRLDEVQAKKTMKARKDDK
jgi:hypothetical protein